MKWEGNNAFVVKCILKMFAGKCRNQIEQLEDSSFKNYLLKEHDENFDEALKRLKQLEKDQHKSWLYDLENKGVK